MAHHVYRTPRLGSWVLINEDWYDARRIATIGHQTRQTRRDAEPSLGHRKQHHAAIRGKPSAVEIGCDLPAPDGWKRELEGPIVGHGGRGRCDDARMFSLDTQTYATTST